MLQNILDANQQIILPIESRLIIYLKQKYLKTTLWSDKKIDEFIEDLYRDRLFSRYWNVNKEELKATIKEFPVHRINFQILIKLIYLSYPSPFKKGVIRLIGDKNPIYSLYVKELAEIFPEAKFIHLIRDYRDNILSEKKTFGYNILSVVSYSWLNYNKSIDKEKHRRPNRFITIKYEDLVTHPETIISNVCQFLNIPYNEEMLSFNRTLKSVVENADEHIKKEVSIIHPNITKPINKSQIKKWEKEFSKPQVELIEYITGDYAALYGYERSLPATRNLRIKLKALLGKIRRQANFLIIKSYYKSPMFLRALSSKMSAFLHQKFKYTNYFNSEDFRENGKTNK